MKDKLMYSKISMLIVSLIFIIFMMQIKIYLEIHETNQAKYIGAKNENIRTDLYQVIGLGYTFSQAHNYSEDYKCGNYSRDFQKLLAENGIESDIVVGCDWFNSSLCHAWVRVYMDYEPQYGKFVDYSGQYNVTEVID